MGEDTLRFSGDPLGEACTVVPSCHPASDEHITFYSVLKLTVFKEEKLIRGICSYVKSEDHEAEDR